MVNRIAEKADIAVYDQNDDLVLIVEAKLQQKTDVIWAAKFRRNLLVHGFLPNARFFLLALPDRFYLWKDSPFPTENAPSYVLDALPIIQPYLERAAVKIDTVTETGFQLLLMSWLFSLTTFDPDREMLSSELTWLAESGLLAAIKRGNVVLGE